MIKIPTIVLIVSVTIIIMYILDQTMGQGNEFNLQIPETEGDMGFVWYENYTKTPEGYIELNWCKACLVKRADKIIKDPYLQLCTVTSDDETITKMKVLFTKYAPPKIKISIVNM